MDAVWRFEDVIAQTAGTGRVQLSAILVIATSVSSFEVVAEEVGRFRFQGIQRLVVHFAEIVQIQNLNQVIELT